MSNLTDPANLNKLADLVKTHIVPGKKDADSLMQPRLTAASGRALDVGGANLGDQISGDKFNIIPVDKVLGQ